MPVSVIFGGQFGSEGKGKVAHALAERMDAAAVVRVGGPNSGHTAMTDASDRTAFRHLPTAVFVPGVTCIIGPGSYLDCQVLLDEIERVNLDRERLVIDPAAVLIEPADQDAETAAGLQSSIGSTLSGTGAAVLRRARRDQAVRFASSALELRPYVRPASELIRGMLNKRARVIVEGTQGHGLSLLHTRSYPYATSRDTTAAAFVAEAGVSPRDVDDVVMVIRAFPIRVGGNSGPLPKETTWEEIQLEGAHDHDLTEYTTVTKRRRRVGRFDADVVRHAIVVNQPTRVALNHLDYQDHACCRTEDLTSPARSLLHQIESMIARPVDLVGWGPGLLGNRGGSELHVIGSKRSA